MQFEHLVQINNPDDPLLTQMSRAQLWRGLMRRVERPQEFLVGVESVRIVDRGDDWLKREMQLGTLLVKDHILLAHEHIIQFATAPSAQHGGGTFTMTIEEPGPGDLFVRFRYETNLPEKAEHATEADDAYFADYVKSAYKATDIDAVRWIRELLETGELD